MSVRLPQRPGMKRWWSSSDRAYRKEPAKTLRDREVVVLPFSWARACQSRVARTPAWTCRERGVPCGHICIDTADKRYRSVDDIKAHISRFFATMKLG